MFSLFTLSSDRIFLSVLCVFILSLDSFNILSVVDCNHLMWSSFTDSFSWAYEGGEGRGRERGGGVLFDFLKSGE